MRAPLQANAPFEGWSGSADAESPRDRGAPSRRADDVLVVVLREALRHDEPEENIDTWHDDDDQDGDGLVDLPAARAICAARDVVDVREQQVDNAQDGKIDPVEQVVGLAGKVHVHYDDQEIHTVGEIADGLWGSPLGGRHQHPVEKEDQEGARPSMASRKTWTSSPRPSNRPAW